MEAWQLVALLGCVILVYAWIFMKKNDSNDYTSIVTDMEDSLEHFAAEMEDRNEQLIEQIARLKAEYRQQSAQWQGRIEQLENQMNMLMNRHEGAQSTDSVQVEESGIAQRYKQLIELHKQGCSVEEIVKRTGINHGEVGLILQLASQEEGRNE